MGGGAAGAGLPLGGPPGSVHGSVPTLYFPADASYHRGRSGSYGMTSVSGGGGVDCWVG